MKSDYMDKKVLVFGAGYVGFSLAVVLARAVNVTVVDIKDSTVDLINSGKSPIIDQGIGEHLERALASKALRATKYDPDLILKADFIILALPTNFMEDTGSFDTDALDSVLNEISRIDNTKSVIIKSTIPVGYSDRVSEKLKLTNLFYSPEFLREGRAIKDNLNPSRLVVGSDSSSARIFVDILTKVAQSRNLKTIFTDNKTAEVIKLASNSYLATRISFFNEIDSLALELDLSSENLIEGICSDKRIGEGYNNPSFGYGGYCLPKDVRQFQSSFNNARVEAPLIQSIDLSNQQRIQSLVNIVLRSKNKNIGIYRAQMKQGSDNSRESVSLAILKHLSKKNDLAVRIYEPQIDLPKEFIKYQSRDLKKFAAWADLILANRDSVELQPYYSKVLTRDIYNEN